MITSLNAISNPTDSGLRAYFATKLVILRAAPRVNNHSLRELLASDALAIDCINQI